MQHSKLFHWLLFCTTLSYPSIAAAEVPGYPTGVEEITFRSNGDGTMQPALFWQPKSSDPAPLLVALHTWSSDFRQGGGEVQYARWCQRAGWAFIHPNFRGANTKPEAMGSDLAVADIVSAVAYARSITAVDAQRIYCVGVSGGGHASLLMAARAPNLWAGVSAWCGISDIAAWYGQCKNSQFKRYADHIEQALGGAPDDADNRRADALNRSPLHWLAKAERLPPLDINHGINDGRAGSVPFSQSIYAWNAAVPRSADISGSVIKAFYKTQKVPAEIAAVNSATADELYGANVPLFRRTDANIRVTIFQGGHEIVHDAALNWLAAQVKGQPANWHPRRVLRFQVGKQDSKSGK